MTNEPAHPAERFESDVRAVRRQAGFAAIALACSAGIRLFNLAVHVWQNALIETTLTGRAEGRAPPMAALQLSDTLTHSGAIAMIVLFIVTATLFLRWLHGLIRLTRVLGGVGMRWSASDGVWAFFIPIVSFKRPYEVLRDVYAELNPGTVPEPVARAVVDQTTGYREVNMQAPPPATRLPDASIGAWWAAFWMGNIIGNIAARAEGSGLDALSNQNVMSATADSVEAFSAVLAILVVRGVTARLVERYRRVRHNPPEVLAAAGISLLETA